MIGEAAIFFWTKRALVLANISTNQLKDEDFADRQQINIRYIILYPLIFQALIFFLFFCGYPNNEKINLLVSYMCNAYFVNCYFLTLAVYSTFRSILLATFVDLGMHTTNILKYISTKTIFLTFSAILVYFII